MSDIIIKKKNEVYLKLHCEPHILYELAPYFEFEVPEAKFMKSSRYKHWDGKVRMLSTHTGELYIGLLDKLIEKIKICDFSYEFEDSKFYGLPYDENEMISEAGVETYIKRILNPSFEVREYQIEAVYQALRHNRKLLVSPTSSGKTIISYCITRYYVEQGLRVLIICPTTSLIEQGYKDFMNYGWDENIPIHRVYGGRAKDTNDSVMISTYQSISDMSKSYFEQFDVVIVDEAHTAKSASICGILHKMCDVKYRFGMTGTTQPEKVHIWTLEGLFGPVYKVIRTDELMHKGTIAKLQINILILEHGKKSFETYEDEVQYIITHEKRNQFIKNLTLDLTGNTLILFSRVETHGQILFDLINSSVINDERKVFFVHGGVDTEHREHIREITETQNNAIIVASYGVFSTGISIKNLNNLIFASPFKSKIRNLQSIGRVLRKSDTKNKAILYDIADDMSNQNRKNYTLNHLIERVKIYNEENFNYQIHKIKFQEKPNE